MSLTITDTAITSDITSVEAHPGLSGKWTVTGYPGRRFDRNQAITAMTIAEERARPNPNRALIDSLESELS